MKKYNFENILFYTLQKLASFFCYPFTGCEYKRIKQYSENRYVFQPVFIIGVPRSGSTFLYQVLTSFFNVLYFDNLSHVFHRHPFLGFRLSHFLYNDKPHNCYKSKFGDTFSYGLHKPSEAGLFWYRWITYLQYFVDGDELSAEQIHDMSNNIHAIINYFKKPFIIKNLSNSMRLRMLKQAFPDARYIYLKRDPRFTAQSMMAARKMLGVHTHELWSVKPRNYHDLIQLEETEKVVKQIYYLENQINDDIKDIPDANLLTVQYENLFIRFDRQIELIKSFITPGLTFRKNYKKPVLRKEPDKIKNRDMFNKIEEEVKKLNWTMYEL